MHPASRCCRIFPAVLYFARVVVLWLFLLKCPSRRVCNLKHSVLDMFVSMAISSSLSEMEDGYRIDVNNGLFNARRPNSFNLVRNVCINGVRASWRVLQSMMKCSVLSSASLQHGHSAVALWETWLVLRGYR